MTQLRPKTTEEFLDRVGRADFQKETGFRAQLVQRAKSENVFPATWLWAVKEFCEARSIDVPEHLFRGHPDASPKGSRVEVSQ